MAHSGGQPKYMIFYHSPFPFCPAELQITGSEDSTYSIEHIPKYQCGGDLDKLMCDVNSNLNVIPNLFRQVVYRKQILGALSVAFWNAGVTLLT